MKTYLFQLMGSEEVYEVKAEDSAEAFRRCLREKSWPIEHVVFLGQRDGDEKGKTAD